MSAIEPYRDEIQEGEHLFQQGLVDEALNVFEAVLEKDPHNVMALNDKGVVLNQQGRFHEAIGAFANVLLKDNQNGNAVFNLISNYFAVGQWEKAESIVKDYGHCLSQTDMEMIESDLEKMRASSRSDSSHETLKVITLSMTKRGKECAFRVCLDIEKFSQKIMWNAFADNALYEPETSELFISLLEEGDCFIDVGSHIGYFSLLAASLVGMKGRILAFEPEEENHRRMKENIVLNGFQNILPFRAAVGAEVKETTFFVKSDNDGGHAMWDVRAHPFNEKTRGNLIIKHVNMLTLDSIMNEGHPQGIKLIKIDTEGSELHVLKGAVNTISRHHVPYILCEINRFALQQMRTNESELRSYARGLGYDAFLLDNQGPSILKLLPWQYVQTNYVFNLLFSREECVQGLGIPVRFF